MMQTDEGPVSAARERWFAPGVNVAHELCDRHDPARVAFTFADALPFAARDLTFGELRQASVRVAAGLHLGVGRGTGAPRCWARGPSW